MRVLLGLGRVELPGAVPRRAPRRASRRRLLGEHDRAVELLAVARHRRQVEAARRAAAGSAAAPRSGRKLKKIAAVAGLERAAARRSTIGSTNSSVTPRVVARLHRVDRVVGVRAGRPRRSRRRRAACAPSACRGPSRSSGRRRSRSGPAAARRGRSSAACGETSRPSVNAWIHVFSRREARAARAGGRCASGRRRARRARAGGRAAPRSNAPTSAAFSKNEPSAIARLTRIRSW